MAELVLKLDLIGEKEASYWNYWKTECYLGGYWWLSFQGEGYLY